MIRAAGALLVLCGFCGLGVRAYLGLSARARALADYAAMLEILRCEIERLEPLERALAAARTVGGTRRFVDAVLGGIEREGGAEVSRAWSGAVELAPGEAREALIRLAPVLGRYGADEQGRALEDARRQILELQSRAEGDRSRNGRLYITLGVCGGIAALALFL